MADDGRRRRQRRGRWHGRRRRAAATSTSIDQEALANSPPRSSSSCTYVLFQAIRDRASDIHLEPFEEEFKIRYRVDGALYELESPPQHLALPLISRVKVMSGLDIAETRLPQDGRIEMSIGGNVPSICA